MIRDIEIGYAVIPEHRKNRYATRAVRTLVDYLFRTDPVERVQATPSQINIASTKILKSSGFKEEGILRHYYFINGSYRDHASYSITREDWEKSHAEI